MHRRVSAAKVAIAAAISVTVAACSPAATGPFSDTVVILQTDDRNVDTAEVEVYDQTLRVTASETRVIEEDLTFSFIANDDGALVTVHNRTGDPIAVPDPRHVEAVTADNITLLARPFDLEVERGEVVHDDPPTVPAVSFPHGHASSITTGLEAPDSDARSDFICLEIIELDPLAGLRGVGVPAGDEYGEIYRRSDEPLHLACTVR